MSDPASLVAMRAGAIVGQQIEQLANERDELRAENEQLRETLEMVRQSIWRNITGTCMAEFTDAEVSEINRVVRGSDGRGN